MLKSQFVTVSEEQFADVLTRIRRRYDYEPAVPGQTTKPDFAISHSGVQVLFDVKQRNPKEVSKDHKSTSPNDSTASTYCAFDPIAQVRHLLKKGREKFKDYHGHLCALVLYNNGNEDTGLHPFCIFGAMLGDPGFVSTLDFDTEVVASDSVQNVFLRRGGKMVEHYAPLKPHESMQNISAIIALESYRIPNPECMKARDQEVERQTEVLGRPLTLREQIEISADLIINRGLNAIIGETWGLTVCTNPFANVVFPIDLFNGPFDERWSMINNKLTRSFVGEQRLALNN